MDTEFFIKHAEYALTSIGKLRMRILEVNCKFAYLRHEKRERKIILIKRKTSLKLQLFQYDLSIHFNVRHLLKFRRKLLKKEQ